MPSVGYDPAYFLNCSLAMCNHYSRPGGSTLSLAM